MASSYYKPCKELDRCLELDKYWEKDMKKWFEGYLIIAEETSYALAECQVVSVAKCTPQSVPVGVCPHFKQVVVPFSKTAR